MQSLHEACTLNSNCLATDRLTRARGLNSTELPSGIAVLSTSLAERGGGLADDEARMNHWLAASDKFLATCDLLLTFQNHLRHRKLTCVG